MKFLVVLLLAGFGLAAATSAAFQPEDDVQLYAEHEVFHDAVLGAEDEDAGSLRKRLEELMEVLKKSRDDGQKPPRETLLQMKKIFDDLEEKGVELTVVEALVKWAVNYYLQNPSTTRQFGDLLLHEDPKSELGRILKKHFEEILEKVKDIIDNGKAYKEDLGEKLKEIAQKLKDMKVDIGDHAKDLLNKLKDKAKDYWKKILDKITPGSDTLLAADPTTELGKILKKHFEEILEKVRDIIENGKAYKEDLGEKLKEIAQKLKDMKVDIGDHAKEVLKKLKDKAKDYWKKILDKITPGSDSKVLFALDPEVKTELGKKLREKFDEIREKLREIFENGKTYKEELLNKMRDVWQNLRNIGEDISEEAKEEMKNLKEKARDYWRRILDKLVPEKEVSFSEEDDVARNLRERFEEILEKIKDAIENRKTLGGGVVAKLKEIYQKMREKSIPFGDKVKEMLEEMREKATGIWKRILDNLKISKRSVEARGTGAENLRERLQELLEKLRDSFRDRKLPGKGFISKLRQIRDEMRQKNVPLGGKLKEMIEQLKEKASGVWRRILDRISQKAPSTEGDIYAKSLRDRLNEILDIVKDGFVTRTTIGGQYLYHLETVWNEMKDKNIPPGDRAIQLIEELKKMTNGEWKALLYKLLPDEE